MRLALLMLAAATLAAFAARAQDEPASSAAAQLPTASAPLATGEAYEDRIRASVAAAEQMQGPLDGRWTLVGADGAAIYVFQLVDSASGRDPLQGVWRDLRRPATPGDIGLIDSLQRSGADLTVSFAASPGAPATVITLKQGAAGGWSGQMLGAGKSAPVSLRRN